MVDSVNTTDAELVVVVSQGKDIAEFVKSNVIHMQPARQMTRSPTCVTSFRMALVLDFISLIIAVISRTGYLLQGHHRQPRL